MGSWRHNKDQLCGIAWGNSSEKVVGVQIWNGDYVQVNWKMVLSKFEKALSEYHHHILYMKGKAVIANTLALSKVFYVRSSMIMPKEFL